MCPHFLVPCDAVTPGRLLGTLVSPAVRRQGDGRAWEGRTETEGATPSRRSSDHAPGERRGSQQTRPDGRPGQTAIDSCAQKTSSSFPACADSVTRPLRTTYGRFFHSAVIGHSFHGPITASSGVTRVPCGHRAATAVNLSDGGAHGPPEVYVLIHEGGRRPPSEMIASSRKTRLTTRGSRAWLPQRPQARTCSSTSATSSSTLTFPARRYAGSRAEASFPRSASIETSASASAPSTSPGGMTRLSSTPDLASPFCRGGDARSPRHPGSHGSVSRPS